jgi:endoglucanase
VPERCKSRLDGPETGGRQSRRARCLWCWRQQAWKSAGIQLLHAEYVGNPSANEEIPTRRHANARASTGTRYVATGSNPRLIYPRQRPSTHGRATAILAWRPHRRVAAASLTLALLVIVACTGRVSTPPLAVRVVGNRLIDAVGQAIHLRGVNRSGAEYACIQGRGFFDGPTGRQAIAIMRSWEINAVRVPLNEDCWLGINSAPQRYSGTRYRAAIRAYVARLNRAGVYVVLDLHWSAPGGEQATGQQPMADLDHAPTFWSSVARAFKADPAVLFDLYNEPHDISWQCWRDGCVLPAGRRTAGMQTLVDAVRSSGARQPIIVTGLDWGNDLSSWLQYAPHDPENQLVAGLHVYSWLSCSTVACLSKYVKPVARGVPVIASEFGDKTCSTAFVNSFMNWADLASVSYLGWSWVPGDCRALALIRSWDGQPTAYGDGLRSHLTKLHSKKRPG